MTQTNATERRTEEEAKPAGGMSGRVVFNAIRHHPVIFLGVLLFTASVGAGVWCFLVLPKKTAAVLYQISSRSHSLLSTGENRADFASYKQAQLVLIKSQRTLDATLKNPEVQSLKIVREADPDAMSWLNKYLIVESRPVNSEIIRVTLEGNDAGELVKVLKALDKAYHDLADEQDRRTLVTRKGNLETALNETKSKLEEWHRRLEGLSNLTKGGLLSAFSPGDKSQGNAILQKAYEDFYTARWEKKAAEASLDVLKKRVEELRIDAERQMAVMSVTGTACFTSLPKDGPLPIPESILSTELEKTLQSDPVMRDLELEVTKSVQKLKKLEGLFKSDSTPPRLLEARNELKAAEAHRDDHKREVRARIQAEHSSLERLEHQRDEAEALYKERQRRAQQADEKLREILKEIGGTDSSKLDREDLLQQIALKEKNRATLSDELERVNLDLKAPSRVATYEEPYEITGLEGNRRLKYTLIATVAAFLLGFGGLVTWEYRSRRVTCTKEVSTELGTRLLGTIPPLRADNDGSISSDHHSPMVEAIDTARIMLTHGTPEATRLRVLMVTSAVSGEGKTTLSGNLAISLTRAGFRTLLIDGDMQAPSAHLLFDVPDSPGLSELLRGDADLARTIQPTPIPGLSVLPAGRWSMSTRQSLVGDRWRLLKRELESRFDFVVIDTSPLLLVSDAMLLAREADGVVLSVLMGVSQIVRVAETVNRLHAIGAQLAGVVVNNVQSEVYHRYMYRSKYATPSIESQPPTSDFSLAENVVEEPIADELVTDIEHGLNRGRTA